MTWVLTDGLGPAWRSGQAARALAGWTDAGPVAVVNVLAARVWHQADLGVERVRLRGAGRRDAGRVLSWEFDGLPWSEGLVDEPLQPPAGVATTAIPVVELDPSWLGPWARFVSAPEPTWFTTTAVLVGAGAARPAIAPEALAPAERLTRFFTFASPAARRLAGLLAAAPFLDSAGLRTVVGIAGADRPALSEVLAFGLLLVDGASFELLPEVRWQLRAQISRGDVDRVHRAVVSASGGGETGENGENGLRNSPGSRVSGARSGTAVPDRGDATPRLHPTTESDITTTMSGMAGTDRSGSGADEALALVADPVTDRNESSAVPGGSSVTSGLTVRPAPTAGRLPRVWGNVPPRNPHFTGREDLLGQLHARIGDGITTVLPEALHGLGGVGKTQLATEYVHRHLTDFDLIWWIPAEQTVQIANALIELGRELGLEAGTEANIAVRQVIEALRVGKPYDRWLLVFDNADEPQPVRRYFPAGPNGRILVTSRNPAWMNVSSQLEVASFHRSESVELLRSRGVALADTDADRVAETLGDLPLAIEQAATWLGETGMTAGEYLRLLEDKLTELLGTPPADYPLPVTAAWNMSLDRLSASNPAAIELLQVCAYFAPTPISRQLLSRAHNETISPALDTALRDPVKLSQAIRDINRYSLARIDHRDNSIIMHRLVQRVLIDRMSSTEQGRMKHGAHVLLAASDPNDPENPDFWRVYADLYPHVVATNTDRCDDLRVRQLLLNICDYLWAWGDHQVSNAFARDVRDSWHESFGEEDPYSLQLGLRFGWGLVTLGRYVEAAEINTRTVELSARVNGPNAGLTIVLMGNVGADLRWHGDFAEALKVAQDANARATRAFGPDDPETVNTARNVAVSLRLMGRYAEAAKFDEETWRRTVALYGEDNGSSLGVLTALTLDRREQGDYLGALAAQETIDARYRRLFHQSADHPARLYSAHDLAAAQRKAGHHEKALVLSRDVAQRLTDRYDELHPSALAAALSLSIDLRHAGRLHEARDICSLTHQRYADQIGETHPHTLAAAVNLALIDRLSGQPDEALDRDERTLAGFVQRLGETHPSSLACAANLASDLYALGRFADALERDRATLAACTEVLGARHPTTLAIAANLAFDLRALGRREEAAELQATTLTQLDAALGQDHPASRQVAAGVRLDCDVDPMPM
ncbi:FxSxx-COOH system tetratricopeptide repeat protein [Frankia sp. CiP3]|uniref:FxSxx-COOH system tetratricopeptide repeat protein n=1 Tax=Frankia sp. CiP3 TaxID=2880971 RepID=UPI001EF70C2B|nr:FxSxx-COOH system tetratricopeptide repeat protein [Frankia sp. CiP3]